MKGIHIFMQKFCSNNFNSYEKVILTLLAIYSVAVNVYAINGSHIYSMTQFIAILGVMTIGVAQYFFTYTKSLYKIFFFFFLLSILIIFNFSYFAISIFSFGIAFSNIRLNNTIRMYKYLAAIQLIVGLASAFLGLLPMKNYRTGVLTFGFINENITGMLLAVFVLCMFFRDGREIFVNKLNLLLLIIVLITEKFLFRDSTVLIMIILFFVFILIFKSKLGKNRITKIISILLPIVLTIISFYVSYNFSSASSNWITRLNEILTERIYIWNYYVSNYPMTLFPSKWIINNNIFNGAFDNIYIYLGLFQGKVMLAITVIGLCIANLKLIKQREFGILAFMLAFEIAGFSENALFNINESFALIFAILAFNPGWMNEEKKF